MRFFIETFGCQMNINDSELMDMSMSSEGFERTVSKNDADIIIFNTCSVRSTAERRATARIRETRAHKKKSLIVLAGCMAQRTGSEFISKRYADITVGPYQTPIIGRILKAYISGSGSRIHSSLSETEFSSRIPESIAPITGNTPWHAYVTITHGCENFCTYCIVPYVRGKLISFKSSAIIEYVRKLLDNGVNSITLLGQNVDQYGQDNGEIPFYSLLDRIASIRGIERLQFMTSHPKDFSEDIVKVIRDHSNISRGIHLPLQSGSDTVLSRMNRSYTLSKYFELVDIIKKHLGNEYALSSDFIVGFPGETDTEFRSTLSAVEKIRFSESFTYAYSPRQGTKAISFEDDIPQEIKIARLNELIALQRQITSEFRKSRIGRRDRVIVEKSNSGLNDEYFGKTSLNDPVIIKADNIIAGSVIEIEVIGSKGTTLYGSIIKP